MTTTLDAPPVAPGDEIAPDYTVIAHLRRGEDFDTYDAWSARRYCRCVLKTPRPDRVDDASVRRALVREGRLLLSLDHPHLVRAYELIAPRDPQPVLVLETLPGATLAHLLDEVYERLDAAALAYLGRHLCSATRYLHDRGRVHLDIKPSNIISCTGIAKVIDLGLARSPGPCPSGVGTARYMSPEQVRGDTVGPAADAWGIGLVLYEAATGHRPFPAGSELSLSHSGSPAALALRHPQLVLRAPRIRTRRRLPIEVAAVIDECLSPDPADRPGLDRLDAALETLL